MSQRKTLARHGNSYALVIERPVMELLGLEPDTLLDVCTDGESLIITPVRGQAREAVSAVGEGTQPLRAHAQQLG